MTAEALVSRHTAAWQAATVHPFLAGVRDGSVPEDAFDRWLAQDYLYAQALVRQEPAPPHQEPAPPHALNARDFVECSRLCRRVAGCERVGTVAEAAVDS